MAVGVKVGEREEMGTQIWKLAGSGCGDSRKLLANAGGREEVRSPAFSLPFLGSPGRHFHEKGLECGLESLKGTTDWGKQIAHVMGVRRVHL